MTLIPLFEEIPAGTTTRANPFIQYFKVQSNTTILRGSVCSRGTGATATDGFNNSALTEQLAKYVAIETIANPTNGTVKIGVVGAGEFVTVRANGIIQNGSLVKLSVVVGTSSIISEVEPWVTGNETALILGRFVGKPSGNVVRDDADPFNETYQDKGDFNIDASVADEIIEIRVGAN